jgi:serine/threonine protein kinase
MIDATFYELEANVEILRLASKACQESQAVKLQSKYGLIKNAQEGHLFNEISIMAQLRHPMILQLNAVGQDNQMIFLYLEYIKYGNLMNVLN